MEMFIPYLEFIYNFRYIVENLCEKRDEEVNMCMGSCHLEKEMEKKDNEKDEAPLLKENMHQTLHYVSNHTVILIINCRKITFHINDISLIDNTLPVLTPPPRA